MGGSEDRQAPPSRAVRDAALEQLTAAYGDGQLTAEEYEERVAGVEAADKAWRLERWINDLQPPPPPVPTVRSRLGDGLAAVREGVRTVWRPLRDDWSSWSRRTKLAVAGGLLAVTAGTVGLVLQEAGSDNPVAVTEQPVTTGLADFRDAYEAEFGTTEVAWVQINPTHAMVREPVHSDPPRYQEWLWQDGAFNPQGTPRGGRPGVVDLAEIDVDAVEATLRRVEHELGVEDVSEVVTLIAPTVVVGAVEEQRITLVLSNDFEESARITTDLDGREIRRTPFDDPRED